MYIYDLSKFAGWFLATDISWDEYFPALHYVSSFIVDPIGLSYTPHYQLPGALEGFASWYAFSAQKQENGAYQKIIDEHDIVITNNIDTLAKVNTLTLNKECIYAIITKCVTEDPKGVGLLYSAAASSLLDRCLAKLKDIERMSYPVYGYKNEAEQQRSPCTERSFWDLSEEDAYPEWIWCLVGNVIDTHPFGEDHTIVHGTRHFSPGTKVYCLPSQWGDGYEQIAVMGKHRGQRGLIKIVMKRELIHNFRCQKVFSPYVIKRMYEPSKNEHKFRGWGQSDEEHETILSMAEWLNKSPEMERRESILFCSPQLLFSITVGGESNQTIQLRIEHRNRRDGCYGAGWYGFYKLGEKTEQSLGLLDWYGYWPDDTTYEKCKANYRPTSDLIRGFIEAEVHNWEKNYESTATNGRRPYIWKFEAASNGDCLLSSGRNACPDNFPSVMRLLTAWGFPKIWNSTTNAPDTFLT